jgi:hypothetical protein
LAAYDGAANPPQQLVPPIMQPAPVKPADIADDPAGL